MKPTADSGTRLPAATVARRRFIWKVGAALSVLASAATTATAGTSKRVANEAGSSSREQLEQLVHRLGLLEDANAIRQLQRAFGHALNNHLQENLASLFADASEAQVNGAVCILDSARPADVIEVAPDRRSATAQFHCLVKAEAPLTSSSTLIEMARQQGQGTRTWWEAGLYENSYVQSADGWKIQRLRYRALERADPPAR